MMIGRFLLSLLVAFSTALLTQATHANNGIDIEDWFDVLRTSSKNSAVISFGMDLFNDIHATMEECREEKRAVELQFLNRSRQFREYFEEVEKAVKAPRFNELVHENKDAIEANFQMSFAKMQKSRKRKLDRVDKKCEEAVKNLTEAKFKEVASYAEEMMLNNPSEFSDLAHTASLFVTELRGFVSECRRIINLVPHQPTPAHSMKGKVNPGHHGEMHFDLCFVEEIQKLISFVDRFLAKADELSEKYYVYSDDEDFYDSQFGESGDFKDHEDKKELPAVTIEAPLNDPKDLDIGNFFEPGPVILPPQKEEDEQSQYPISSFFEPGPVILGHHKEKVDKSEPSPSTTEAALNGPKDLDIGNFLEPGPVILPSHTEDVASPTPKSKPDEEEQEDYYGDGSDDKEDDDGKSTESKDEIEATQKSKTDDEEQEDYYDGTDENIVKPEDETEATPENMATHNPPDWLDDAFDDVLGKGNDQGQEEGELDEKELKVAAHSRSKFEGDEEGEEPEHQGRIDLSLPGVDVEIDSDGIDIESNEGDSQKLSIVFDDDPVFTTESNTEDDDGDFVTYMLIYFFITLGSLLLLTVIVLSVAIVVLKMRSRTPKDTPLLSEDEKIAVMKQSGYVNPTYKFFDNVNEV